MSVSVLLGKYYYRHVTPLEGNQTGSWWMKRQRNDPYVQMAHEEGRVSRAAYKLQVYIYLYIYI